MKKHLNVLIVEDEPIFCNYLKDLLNKHALEFGAIEFKHKIAHNCSDALKLIHRSVDSNPFDLVFLDISIPPSKIDRMYSGEDIGEEIRKFFTKTIITIITNISCNYRINNLITTINPEGLIIKTDVDGEDLKKAIKSVVNLNTYYSRSVLKVVRKQMTCNIKLDKIDRDILFLISQGYKMKDIIKEVHLSISGLESRKRKLKDLFQIENGGDKKLIERAQFHGFI
jgi:DNA-binding NarL/FixJ family response regulator